jgi:t-SNARE complex subunit (syntaxin)
MADDLDNLIDELKLLQEKVSDVQEYLDTILEEAIDMQFKIETGE